DRDDAAGTAIPDTIWPETMVTTQPSTWGQIHFGLPVYDAPAATPGGVVTIQHGLNGTAVPDADVGGGTVCGAGTAFWPEWGSLNHAGSPYVNIQNQWNLGDWPCFSKYYITFPLDALPTDRAILSATLTLYQFGNSNQGGLFDPSRPPQPSLIQVLTIVDDWQESTLTWNNAPLPVENVGRSWVDPLPAGPPWPNVPRQWDVSRAVAEAYAAGQPLRLALYSADNAMHSGKYFRSSDADAEARPTLEVLWGDDKGFAVTVDPVVQAVGSGETAMFTINVQPTNGSVSSATVETGNPYADLSVTPLVQTLSTLPNTATLSVTDLHGGAFSDSLWYTLPITVTGGTAVQTTSVSLLLNGWQTFLPAVQNGG
ncbi:MAG: DNRLRE domain-containing protein, partial [Anaerolineae bacterium]